MKRRTKSLFSFFPIAILVVTIGQCVGLAVADNSTQFYPTRTPPAITIESPNNSTIYNNIVPLNFTVTYNNDYAADVNTQWINWLGYRMDDKSAATLQVDLAQNTYPFQRNTTINLTEISQGQHKLEIIVNFYYTTTIGIYAYNFSSIPVYFSIYTTPPVISCLSPENKTYNTTTNLPLSVKVDRSVSWMGYSLDGQVNVTITGNITLPELPYGSHRVTLYANDTRSNMAASNEVYFNLANPQPSTPSTSPPSNSAQASTTPSTSQQPTPSNSASPTGNNAILRADTYWTAATIVTVIIAVIAVAFMLKKQHASR
jgi:hypothetical protein